MSMFCTCGAKAFCINSRFNKQSNETYRRYKCPKRKCARRWSTLEVMVGGKAYRPIKARAIKQFTKKAVTQLRDEVLEIFDKRKSS